MPTSRKVQEYRRATIRSILMEHEIRNQKELLAELAERGITGTQSSISRDLQEIGAVRIDGVYGFPRNPRGAEAELKRVLDFVREARTVGACMTVIKTDPGAGPLVARAIDAGNWKEVSGTVAGPDSVLVLTDDARDHQGQLWERLDRVLGFEPVLLDEPDTDDDAAPGVSRVSRFVTLPRRS